MTFLNYLVTEYVDDTLKHVFLNIEFKEVFSRKFQEPIRSALHVKSRFQWQIIESRILQISTLKTIQNPRIVKP